MSNICVINISYSIHDATKMGLNPSPVKSGKAIKVINGNSKTECEELLDKFFIKNGITKLEEKK